MSTKKLPVPSVADFKHSTAIHIRFFDLDALGHVNNSRYLGFLEEARLSYAKEVLSWDGNLAHLGLVVANVRIDYKLPIFLGDDVVIYSKVNNFSARSFEMEYLITKTDKNKKTTKETIVVSVALVTIVSVDYKTGKAVPVPQDWRQAVTAFERHLTVDITGAQ